MDMCPAGNIVIGKTFCRASFAKSLAPLVRLAMQATPNEGPNELQFTGASSQALTGWIGVIATIGLCAIRIIGARRRSAGGSSEGCAGDESPATVIGSRIAAAVIAPTIAAAVITSTIAARDGASAIAAGHGASTIAAAPERCAATTAERRAASATERRAASAAERRAAAAAATPAAESEGVPDHGDSQQANAHQ
jgi:hypothetical protein